VVAVAASLPAWLVSLFDWFRQAFEVVDRWLHATGLPLGGILIGLALGALAYGGVEAARHRPSTDGAGTVRVSVVPSTPSGTAPETGPATGSESPPPVPVRVFGRGGDRTVWMTGAGAHPSLPMRRARGFVAVLAAAFVVTAVLLLRFYPLLFARYDRLVAIVGGIIYWPIPWPGVFAASVSKLVVPDYIFPMYLAGMAAFAIASGLVYRRPPLPVHRRLLALVVVLAYVGIELVIDALFFTVPGDAFRDLALLVRAFAGGTFLALLIFCAIFLPSPQRIRPRFSRDRAGIRRFFAVALLAVALAGSLLLLMTVFVHANGIILGFTILLLLPLLSLELFATFGRSLYFSEIRHHPLPSVSEYHPSVSIIMPAYNEEEWIEEAILHADRAAAKYPGPVQLIVGNDGSTDRTLEIARTAVNRLEHARGFVVDLPHGGKSNALNGALALATGEIVIRCDADTFISEETGFAALIPHFSDPEVGGVQGAIHPRQREGWTRKLRALEVAWNHYFLRPAGMVTRSAEVIDGLFSAFRRQELLEIGGYVPWNGEDTEIAIRFQRLGYRVRIEFDAVAYEDVPENYDSLRRQRVRWARGILMANGQHYPSLLGKTPEFAGLAVLFWFLLFVRSGVRSLVYIFLALLIVFLGVPALVATAYIFLVAIVMRSVPLAFFLVRMRRTDVLLWIPFFPIGNIIKQTFRFEAFGTLGPGATREYV